MGERAIVALHAVALLSILAAALCEEVQVNGLDYEEENGDVLESSLHNDIASPQSFSGMSGVKFFAMSAVSVLLGVLLGTFASLRSSAHVMRHTRHTSNSVKEV